jgi:hypothetical protein
MEKLENKLKYFLENYLKFFRKLYKIFSFTDTTSL